MKKLLVLHSPPFLAFPKRIAEEFNKLDGNATVMQWVDLMPLSTDFKLDGYDIVHPRFGGRGDGDNVLEILEKFITSIKFINKPKRQQITSNKFKAIVKASSVMEVPETVLVNPVYNTPQQVLSMIEPPLFMKPIYSSGGKNVFLISNEDELKEHFKYFSSSFIVQKAVKFQRQLRVIYIGKVIDAVYDLPREEYWATVCKNPRVRREEVNPELRRTVENIANTFEMEIMTVDLFYYEGRYIFNEVNTATNLDYVMASTGTNYAKLIAEYLFSNS